MLALPRSQVNALKKAIELGFTPAFFELGSIQHTTKTHLQLDLNVISVAGDLQLVKDARCSKMLGPCSVIPHVISVCRGVGLLDYLTDRLHSFFCGAVRLLVCVCVC